LRDQLQWQIEVQFAQIHRVRVRLSFADTVASDYINAELGHRITQAL
jgi:hypothetical protein